MGSSTKENDGRGARKKMYNRLIIIICCFVTIIGILNLFGFSSSSNSSSNDSSRIKQLGKQAKSNVQKFYKNNLRFGGGHGRGKAIRGGGGGNHGGRRNTPSFGTINLNVDDPNSKKGIDLILSASINLIDIDINNNVFESSVKKRRKNNNNNDDTTNTRNNKYGGVYGEFCQINFDTHKSDPSNVPMFRDLIAASPGCSDNGQRYKINLYDIVTLSKKHDMDVIKESGGGGGGGIVPKSLHLSGVVFHESRCGSTLVANSLIGMNPTKHRVYSESSPPLKAMGICGGGTLKGESTRTCSDQDAALVLKDVIYMMSRTNQKEEERLFFKIQSAGTHFISVFREAFPDVPWIFLYRKPVEVMMSHMVGGKNANCVRTKKRPPFGIKQIIKEHQMSDNEMSYEMYCAAHLACICEAAVDQLDLSDGVGKPVNYELLPDILYNDILPNHFKVSVSDEEIQNIRMVSNTYSKNRGGTNKKNGANGGGGNWVEDSQRKENSASNEIKDASKEFLEPPFNLLQGEMRDYADNDVEEEEEEGEGDDDTVLEKEGSLQQDDDDNVQQEEERLRRRS